MAIGTGTKKGNQVPRNPGLSPEQKEAEKANPRLTFIRLANARVPKAQKALKQVANLFTANYQWADADHEAVMAALTEAVEVVKLAARKDAGKPSFSIE